MKIAVIGAGNVGLALGKRFAEVGNEVLYGVRNPSEYENKELKGKVGTNAEACESAELLILAVPYDALSEALNSCGDISGKILIDATNPLEMTENGLALTLGFETSGGERLQELCPDAKVVKCFNTTGFTNMENPNGSMMFACGNDQEATEKITKLAVSIGFDAINIGDISKARLLEPLAMLWIHLAFNSELKRNFAFTIQRYLETQ